MLALCMCIGLLRAYVYAEESSAWQQKLEGKIAESKAIFFMCAESWCYLPARVTKCFEGYGVQQLTTHFFLHEPFCSQKAAITKTSHDMYTKIVCVLHMTIIAACPMSLA